MSLLWLFKRFVDPAGHRDEEEERRRQREAMPPEVAESKFDVTLQVPQARAERYRCRVCGAEASERAFCKVCLADTMVAVDGHGP